MRWNRIWFLVATLLVASLFGGMATQEAQAQGQAYRVDVDNVVQRSFLLGQDIIVLGTLNILEPQSQPDTVTVTVFSPDTTFAAQALDIDVGPSTPPQITFAIQQITFVGGDFSFSVTSARHGTLVPSTNYPVSNFDVRVRVSSLTGEVGSPFVVTTTIDVGNMSEMQSRIDVEYLLDGALLRDTSLIALFGDVIALIQGTTITLVTFDQDEAARSWETTQTFTLSPGAHTLAVRVVDRSVSQTVFTDTFTIQVSDQIGALETRVDQLDLDLSGTMDELSGQAESASQAAAAAGTLAGSVFAISLVAIVLSTLTLLIQFGILKLGRFGRRGPEEPQE